MFSDDPEFRKKYGDILNSILLSGTATVCGPNYLKNDTAYERLASEGILKIVEQDHSKDLRTQLSDHYEKAFIGYRELESHPNYSSKKYIDDIINENAWKPFSDIDLEEKKGNLEFHEHRLHNTLFSVTDSLRGLFGHHFDANRSFYGSLISEIIGDLIPDTTRYDIQSLVGAGPSFNSMFEIMGLGIQSAELQDSNIPLFSFLPGDLSEFREKDNSLFDFSGGFENYAKLGMEFSFRLNHSDYVLAHSFWKALFEMIDLLHFSEQNKCPIYMPLDIPISKGVNQH